MLSKNWKSILNINNKNIVIVTDKNSKSVAKSIIDSEEIIKENIENYYLFPSLTEILEKDKQEIIKKYSSDFKSFLTKQEKKLLITHEVIFSSLVKEDKQKDFIELLLKNKKHLLIISENKYEKIEDLIYYIDFEDWDKNLNAIERFKEINIIFKKTFNPFKDPKYAFSKYKEI